MNYRRGETFGSATTTSSSAVQPLTPDSSASDSEKEEPDGITESWHLAIKKCKDDLRDNKLVSFPTSKAVTEGLRQSRWAQLLPRVQNSIGCMKRFLAFFDRTMLPRHLECSTIWGLMFLLVTNPPEIVWDSIGKMLRGVTCTLDTCERECCNTAFDEPMKHFLVEAFMDPIKLWTDLIKYIRDHPNDIRGITSKLDSTSGKVQESFAHLKEIAYTRRGTDLRQASTFSGPLPDNIALPCGGAPYHDSKKFVGREKEIAAIHGELGPTNMKDQKFCTIWGFAGMGKSKLAMEYAKRHEDEFYATLWISAQNAISIGQSFTNIAIDLGLQKATNGGKVEENIRLVFNAIKQRGGNWLIIWDNVKEQATIRPYLMLNSKRVSTLVTTKYPEEAAFFRSRGPFFQLKKLSMASSVDLFTRLLGTENLYPEGSEDSKAAHAILQKMDGHPLGICTMATRIVAKNLSIRGFLGHYQKGQFPVVSELADYETALEAIWNESFQELKDMKESGHGDSFGLLGVLAFCFPDAIPKTLFVNTQTDDSEGGTPIFRGDQESYEEACETLRKSGLIDYDRDFTSITMHRLTQGAFLAFLGPEPVQSFFCLAASLIHRAFPKQVEGRSLHLQWDDCRTYIQHSNKLIKAYTESKLPHQRYQPLQPCEEFLELMANVCWYLVESGQDSECQRLSEIALKAVEPDTYRYAHLNNSLFAMSWFQNDLKSAYKYCDIAVSSMKAHKHETSEEYLGILSNKANLLASDNKDNEALELYVKVEETRKKYNYPENIALAFINLGIGRLKSKMGEFDDAAARLEVAREIVRHEHGARGKYMQQVYFDLGNLELKRGNFPNADKNYAIGQEIQKKESEGDFLNSSFLFKRACIQLELGILDLARQFLDSALSHSVKNRHEGEEARVLNKLAKLAKLANKSDASALQVRAKRLKSALEEKFGITQDMNASDPDQYDKLVCVVYR